MMETESPTTLRTVPVKCLRSPSTTFTELPLERRKLGVFAVVVRAARAKLDWLTQRKQERWRRYTFADICDHGRIIFIEVTFIITIIHASLELFNLGQSRVDSVNLLEDENVNTKLADRE